MSCQKVNKIELMDFIKKNKPIVCLFYGEWSGESFMTETLIDAFAKIIKDEVTFLKINVDQENMWEEKNFNIKCVPTVKVLSKDFNYEFQGFKTKLEFLNIIKQLKASNL